MERTAHISLAVALIACGGKQPLEPDAPPIDAEVVPVLRNPVALDDRELARQALALIGADLPGAVKSCDSCHGVTRQRMAYWRALSDGAVANCLTDLAVTTPESARAMIECLRSMPGVPGSDLEASRLGVYAAATSLPWFQYVLRKGYGDEAPAQAARLEAMVAMPRGTALPRWTQPEFDIVAEWFARGLPRLDQTLVGDPPPTECLEGVSARVPQHVAAMKTEGWRAINSSNLMPMHGCGAATDPKLCLTTVPLAVDQPFGVGWELPGRGRLRVLADVDYSTSFWTRSSADGRFVGYGVRNVPGSYIYDLQRGLPVSVDALYDPGFFPDNTGFMFQGGPRNVCAMGVLTSNPTAIAMTEAGCTDITTIGLYQHVGRATGGDYFAIDSRFVSDDGGHVVTRGDPDASFSSNASIGFVPMMFDGVAYTPRAQVTVKAPFEGDTVLSPSARMVISRVAGPSDAQLGFVLREVNATFVGDTYTITAPEVARYCHSGGKPGFSYDERWIVYHHYVTPSDAVELGFTGPDDPNFAPYLMRGAANTYLLELATGAVTRITHMAPGQYALFPHFRSDGWIYLQVRDINANREYTIASDAALLAE